MKLTKLALNGQKQKVAEPKQITGLQKSDRLAMLFWLVIILLFWEFAPRVGLANSYLLPPFSKVVVNMFNQVVYGDLSFQVLNSLYLVVLGCVIGVAFAILATLLCLMSRSFEMLFSLLSTIFNPLPGLAVLPLVMMWFGIGNGAMLALIVHGIVWPLLSDLLTGYRAIPKIYEEYARNIRVKPLAMLRTVVLYAVLPNFISGLRIGWGRAWRALIGAEMVFGMVGTLGGLGYYIYIQRSYANIPNMMAGLLMIIAIGILVEEFGFRLLEKHTIQKWGMSRA